MNNKEQTLQEEIKKKEEYLKDLWLLFHSFKCLLNSPWI